MPLDIGPSARMQDEECTILFVQEWRDTVEGLNDEFWAAPDFVYCAYFLRPSVWLSGRVWPDYGWLVGELISSRMPAANQPTSFNGTATDSVTKLLTQPACGDWPQYARLFFLISAQRGSLFICQLLEYRCDCCLHLPRAQWQETHHFHPHARQTSLLYVTQPCATDDIYISAPKPLFCWLPSLPVVSPGTNCL
jgi:hypothetical protein